jgi:hypothetical protein
MRTLYSLSMLSIALLLSSCKVESSKKDVPESLETVTSESFARSRAPFKGRPKPSGLKFNDAAMEGYLNSLPENLQFDERRRFSDVKEAKPYLVQLLKMNSYYDMERGLLLRKDGKAVRRHLAVRMANESLLLVKASPEGASERLRWEELDFGQYEVFFNYFIELRKDVSAGVVDARESNVDAACDYLFLATLCDWYGRYPEALEYARKAVSLEPDLKQAASSLLLVR